MKTGPTDRLVTTHFPSHQKILYCVLNWGLGHASRSIPVIEALLQKGNEITLASDGMPLALLRRTFPDLPTKELPAYGIRYPRASILQNMLLQAWSINKAIRKENMAVEHLYDNHGYDYIISDNRPGCYHPACTSIFISHQLEPHHPNAIIRWLFKHVNQWHFRHFQQLWVPDDDQWCLSGNLSKADFEKPEVLWIGLCSQMIGGGRIPEKKIALILSGPEPQRSFLEAILIKQLSGFKDYEVTLVRGTDQGTHLDLPTHWEVIHLADAGQVNQLMHTSALVVCRSGYSTLADLAVTGCPALLIPTPGQTEQEYLAERHRLRWPGISQKDFTLSVLQKVLEEGEK
ncbi:MAG: glycosyltransferase [Saprospiraceae bacterium]|nr:glycosyltransferase [Saprospiraceae bacterium]